MVEAGKERGGWRLRGKQKEWSKVEMGWRKRAKEEGSYKEEQGRCEGEREQGREGNFKEGTLKKTLASAQKIPTTRPLHCDFGITNE